MYTQCPACSTLFRISEQQLSAAKGKVRCGQCDHIYNAQGTLLNSLPAQPASPPPVTAPGSVEKTASVTNEPAQPASPILETDEVLDIITEENQLEEQDIKIHDIDLTDDVMDSDDDEVYDMSPTLPDEELDDDDWQVVNLGSNETVDEEDEDDDWFDDDHGLPEVNNEPGSSSSLKAPAGIDEDDWQMVDLGGSETVDEEDEDDDWFDDDINETDSTSSLKAPSGVDEDDWEMVDLGGSEIVDEEEDEDDDWFAEDQAPQADNDLNDDFLNDISVNETTEDNNSDLMRNVSDYLDDDAADERFSDEKASNILNEVQQQLSFPIEDSDKDIKPATSGIDLPGNWLDDMYKPSKSSSTSIPMSSAEELELDNAILKSIERPFTPVKKPADNKPAFKAKESIVLESNDHLIGQHDKKAAPVKNDAIPLRLRNSLNVVPDVPRGALKWLGIFISILVLVAGLAAQAIMFRSTELANMYPEWQPLLLEACEKLPCRDASKQAIDQIQLMNRNISQHPKVKTALLIQAAILNRANFAQRYPNIQITLSDLTGDTVAQRTFTPKEYLGSLYHPFLQMKPGKPVHIALEVLDPGSTAINFEFRFL